MEHSKRIALSVATALGIGFAGAGIAHSGYGAADTEASRHVATSNAAMETHFGAHPGTVSYFHDFSHGENTATAFASPSQLSDHVSPAAEMPQASEAPTEHVSWYHVSELPIDGTTFYTDDGTEWYALAADEVLVLTPVVLIEDRWVPVAFVETPEGLNLYF